MRSLLDVNHIFKIILTLIDLLNGNVVRCNSNPYYVYYSIAFVAIILISITYNFTRVINEVLNRGARLSSELMKLYLYPLILFIT